MQEYIASPWVTGFSYPAESDGHVLNAIVGTYGQSIAQAFLTTARGTLDREAPGLSNLISDWAKGSPDFNTAWDYSFGRVEVALASDIDLVEVGTRLGLRLTEQGQAGSWKARLVQPTPLIMGSLLFYDVESVHVDSPSSSVVLHSSTETYTCRKDPDSGEWRSEKGTALASIGRGGRISLLTEGAVPGSLEDPQRFAGVEGVPQLDKSMTESFRAGYQAIGMAAPEYLPWIERVLRYILVSRRGTLDRLVSGSAEVCPGAIHISYPQLPMELAEVMIHEAAHQYFYIVERLGPVDDGSDPTLYWSPPMRMNRPLSRLLVAYHALANVLLFYAKVQESGIDDQGYVNANISEMRATVAKLAEPLHANRALTDLGRGLYDPLAERLSRIEVLGRAS